MSRLLPKMGEWLECQRSLEDNDHWTTTLGSSHPILPSSRACKCPPEGLEPVLRDELLLMYEGGMFLLL